MTTRGFFGRRRETPPRPIPPGQYLERGFPVLTAGPTQRVPLEQWTFSLVGVDGEPLGQWTWQEFCDLPRDGDSHGHPLRDQVEQTGYQLEGRYN